MKMGTACQFVATHLHRGKFQRVERTIEMRSVEKDGGRTAVTQRRRHPAVSTEVETQRLSYFSTPKVNTVVS